MSDNELEKTLEQLEIETMEMLDNPYKTYRVEFPYTCSITIPEDGYNTRISIETRSEVLRYGRNEHDIELQLQLDQEHGRPTFAKHILGWVRDKIGSLDPTKIDVDYGTSHKIEEMTDEQIEEFAQSCLNDE
jgi:hypothetical protein